MAPDASGPVAAAPQVRTVLLVSYTFPPQYDVSARRAVKLCKYLPAAGWRPIVLTKDWATDIASEDRQRYVITSQPDALADAPGVRVVRAPYRTRHNALRSLHRRLGGAYEDGQENSEGPTPNDRGHGRTHGRSSVNGAPVAAGIARVLGRKALSVLSPTFGDFPDPFRGWVDVAVQAGVDLIRAESVDAICSLCPPATAHVVASEIARRTGVPWVAQFDDLFSFRVEGQPNAAWRWYARRAHRAWMRHATLAGAITPAMLEYVRRTYDLDGDVVMVGFDPDESPHVERERRDRLRLVYTGSVYLDDQRPELLFEALERVLASRPSDVPPIEVVFAGTRREAELQARLARFPAAARACVFTERMAPDATHRLQRSADALVLLNYTTPAAAAGTLSFPAKCFEYLNAGRPILALPRDPGGWGDRLLETTGAGVSADSAADAAAVLERWLATWTAVGELPYAGDATEIARYAQPRQVAVLACLLDHATARGADVVR